jgi:hypothetical protein
MLPSVVSEFRYDCPGSVRPRRFWFSTHKSNEGTQDRQVEPLFSLIFSGTMMAISA